MTFTFEWDPAKAVSNRAKHGVSFEDGATVFVDARNLTIYDPDHSESEDRWVTIGRAASGRLLVVVHTARVESDEDATIRIISARKSTSSEAAAYEGN